MPPTPGQTEIWGREIWARLTRASGARSPAAGLSGRIANASQGRQGWIIVASAALVVTRRSRLRVPAPVMAYVEAGRRARRRIPNPKPARAAEQRQAPQPPHR